LHYLNYDDDFAFIFRLSGEISQIAPGEGKARFGNAELNWAGCTAVTTGDFGGACGVNTIYECSFGQVMRSGTSLLNTDTAWGLDNDGSHRHLVKPILMFLTRVGKANRVVVALQFGCLRASINIGGYVRQLSAILTATVIQI